MQELVLLRKVKLADLLGPVMGNVKKGVGALAVTRAKKWDVAVLVNDCNGSENGRFFKSIQDYVDEDEKKANFALMLTVLFSAIETDNYQAEIKGSAVKCKDAYSFRFHNVQRHLWELKQGKKDRIYFCTEKRGERGVVVLLMAFHKKDQNTPPEVTSPCKAEMKRIFEPGNKFQYCPETNHETQKSNRCPRSC